VIAEQNVGTIAEASARSSKLARILVYIGIGAVLLSLVRVVTGAEDLTSTGAFSATLRLGVPILLAGLGGMFAERCGVVNIGLEGMMILGTWFGAWGATTFGVWEGVALGIVGGALGGLIHAVATVTFGVDHVVSGVAINILGAGVARYLSVVAWVGNDGGGGATQSPKITADIPDINIPFLAGGLDTPDALGRIASWRWFLVSDVAGFFRALTGDLSLLTLLSLLLIPATALFLWRTPLGLRLRSAGENPYAAESLGVNVYLVKYIGVLVSGALAGLGGAFLTLETGNYLQGQTGGRGFIGLAALIFGNWRPTGIALGAGLFGFADALRLRDESSVHALVLLAALAAIAGTVWMITRKRYSLALVLGVSGAVFGTWYAVSDTIPRQFVSFTPYIVTLLVLAFATQRLRPPAYDGIPYRKGEHT
jgi:ABC-type uncharacterized transport system permease subunit